MTEFWVSQGKHWCDACKCWMSDTVNARAAHERGIGHKTNVQRKLRDMRIKADTEKKEAEKTERSLAAIEKAAEKAYAKDLAAQEAEAPPLPAPSGPPPQFGTWGPQEGSAYLYNTTLRWYYDAATDFYYGGEPPVWTKDPSIPEGALYAAMNKPNSTEHVTKRIIKASAPHAAALIGGYQMPVEGIVKGRTIEGGPSAEPARKAATKRPRDVESAPKSKKQLDEEAAREAARKRVAARTAAEFGLS